MTLDITKITQEYTVKRLGEEDFPAILALYGGNPQYFAAMNQPVPEGGWKRTWPPSRREKPWRTSIGWDSSRKRISSPCWSWSPATRRTTLPTWACSWWLLTARATAWVPS